MLLFGINLLYNCKFYILTEKSLNSIIILSIEILPAVMLKIIKGIVSLYNIPLIIGGLIFDNIS